MQNYKNRNLLPNFINFAADTKEKSNKNNELKYKNMARILHCKYT